MELLASRDDEVHVHVKVVVRIACRDKEVYVWVVVHLTNRLANIAEEDHEQK